tara:strand:- start:903 stop:1508 length:606 start_codon:yes stop_codon:yes gene_type:complete
MLLKVGVIVALVNNYLEKPMSLFRKTRHDAILPKRGTKASAGHDFYALTGGRIEPNQRCHIKTGIGWSGLMEDFLYGHLKERSSHASKYGLLLLAGIIDADYPNDIVVILLNTGDKTFSFEAGDRIAQMMVLPYAHAVDEAFIVEKRTGGFGSTNEGVKPSDENLCDFCIHDVPTCKGNPTFGDGKGNDNVIACTEHREPF